VPKYICERCCKEFSQECHYNDHINRKIPCAPNCPKTAPNCPKTGKNDPDDEYICGYCKKKFTRKYHLMRHIDNNCKMKKANDNKMEEVISILIEMKEKTKILEKKLEECTKKNSEEIEKLKEENTKYKQIINNNTQNIKIDTMNVNINPYGKEDIKHFTNTDYKYIFNRGTMGVPAFVEKVHFDKNKPENHNVYISNMRADYGLLYDGNQWTIHNKEDLLENMYENKTVILLDQFEKRYDTLDEQTKKMFERFVKRYESDDDKLKMIVKKELQQILYNKRKMAENLKR
jgi:hypothetical protein